MMLFGYMCPVQYSVLFLFEAKEYFGVVLLFIYSYTDTDFLFMFGFHQQPDVM